MKTNYSEKRIEELDLIVHKLTIKSRSQKWLSKKEVALRNKLFTILIRQNNYSFTKKVEIYDN